MPNQILWEPGDVEESEMFSLDPKSIWIQEEIGKGAFSIVHAGVYQHQQVAVKRQPKQNGKIPNFVLKEISILHQINHPNLLEYVGASDAKELDEVWILTERLVGGDLNQLLQQIRKGTSTHLGWKQFVSIALDTAVGVGFLHHQGIIHRDIKSSNILLDDHYHTKLCDFGFAMDMKLCARQEEDVGKARRKSYCGTDAYMAPEMFLDEDYDQSVDVFSFGVVLMEMICCRQANADGFLLRLPQRKFALQMEEFRMNIPLSCPHALVVLAEECASFEPKDRPSIDQVIQTLEKMLVVEISQQDALKQARVELVPYTPSEETSGQQQQLLDSQENPQIDDDENGDLAVEQAEAELVAEKQAETKCSARHCTQQQQHKADPIEGALGSDVQQQQEEESKAKDVESEVAEGASTEAAVATSLEGPLLKRNRRKTRTWTPRWFHVENGLLHYSAMDQRDEPTSLLRTQTQRLRSSLCLRGCQLKKTSDMSELTFQVVDRFNKIKRELQALTHEDLVNWMQVVQQGIEFANANHHLLHRGLACDTKNDEVKTRFSLQLNQVDNMDPMEDHTDKEDADEHDGGVDDGSRVDTELARCSDPELSSECQKDELWHWLEDIGMQRFDKVLRAKGFNSVDYIRETGIEEEDLNFLEIFDQNARQKLTKAARKLRNEE